MGLLSTLARNAGRRGARMTETGVREAFDTPLGRSRMADAFRESPLFGRTFMTTKELEALEAASRGLSDEEMLRLLYGASNEPEMKMAPLLLRKANRKLQAPEDYRWEDGLYPETYFGRR